MAACLHVSRAGHGEGQHRACAHMADLLRAGLIQPLAPWLVRLGCRAGVGAVWGGHARGTLVMPSWHFFMGGDGAACRGVCTW